MKGEDSIENKNGISPWQEKVSGDSTTERCKTAVLTLGWTENSKVSLVFFHLRVGVCISEKWSFSGKRKERFLGNKGNEEKMGRACNFMGFPVETQAQWNFLRHCSGGQLSLYIRSYYRSHITKSEVNAIWLQMIVVWGREARRPSMYGDRKYTAILYAFCLFLLWT
jgi:hypothetical protein